MYKIYNVFFISRPFSSAVIRMSDQCPDVCTQCEKVCTQYLDVSRHISI